MKDFIDARQETIDDKVRLNVPVLRPGLGVIGKFGAEAGQRFSGFLITLYSIPAQPLRMLRRTINRVIKPQQPIYEQAELRNIEIVVTDNEILYCPASPLLLRTYTPLFTEEIADTSINFETVTDEMSKLTVGSNVWNVHPEYAGDVRWALRRLADDNPSYSITFSGGELAEADTPLAQASADDVTEDESSSEEE